MNVLVISNVTAGEFKIDIVQFIDLTDWLLLLSFSSKPNNFRIFYAFGNKKIKL